MSSLAQNGAPTPRRSARISQAGSVTEKSVLTAVTPGGSQKEKKAPLSKIKPRKSNAYGASGRVGVAEELTVADTGFAKAFENQRVDAVTRDDEEEDEDDDSTDELAAETPQMSRAINGRDYRRSPSTDPRRHQHSQSNFSFEESEDFTPSDGLESSMANTSKSFGLTHEAGMLSQTTTKVSPPITALGVDIPLWQRNAARRAQLVSQATSKEKEVAQVTRTSIHHLLQVNRSDPAPTEPVPPPRVPIQERAPISRTTFPSPNVRLPQIREEFLNKAQIRDEDDAESPWKYYLMCAFGILLVSMLTSLAWSAADKYTSAGRGSGSGPGSFITNSPLRIASWFRPRNAFDSAWGTGSKVDLGNDSNGHDGLRTRVQQLYTDLDTRMDDMQEVIMTLKNDLPETMLVRNNRGRYEITDEFWQALISKADSSPKEWESYLSRNAEKLKGILSVSRSVGDSGSGPVAVSREEFLRLIEQRYAKLAAQIERRAEEIIESRMSQMRTITQSETRKAVLDSIRQQSLAQGNLQANYDVNILKANFFSPGLGAIIDPTFSSSTYMPGSKWSHRLAFGPQRNPQAVALRKWEEPGDNWCAAPESTLKGRAQLAISLSQPVFPTQVTIEHAPKTMVPGQDLSNAPRHVELWVQTDQPVQSLYGNKRDACQEGPAGWTCLGAFKYNIHASNHVQTFDLDAESSVPVSKTMVRVLSNWGSDHTCLYRVRLHGRPVVEDHEYNVVLNDPVEK